MSSIKLVNSMAYPVVWLNQSSTFSLRYMYIYTWVNLNFKLVESPPSVRMLFWLMEGYIGLFLLAEIVFLFIVTTVVIDGWSLPNSNRLQEKSFSAYSVAKEVWVLYPGSLWWQDYRRIFLLLCCPSLSLWRYRLRVLRL